ncbi:MAG: hypothetical protein VX346_11405 [Planctomycetota bacterium]|nr:hypothetical protein [Planctomycetota bacterium]
MPPSATQPGVPGRSGPRRAPPPDYFSRRVRFKIFLLVCVFMLVVVMMEKARDPSMYAWMGFDRADKAARNPAAPHLPTENRVPVQRESSSGEIPGLVQGPRRPETPWQRPAERPMDRLGQAESLAWNHVWTALRRGDRDTLNRWLERAQTGGPYDRAAGKPVISQLAEHWSGFLKQQRQLLIQQRGQLKDDGHAEWTSILDQLHVTWSETYKPALELAASDASLTTQQQQTLQNIQDRIGEFAITKVRDNTLHRAIEQEAWFHLLDILQRTPEPLLQERSTGNASYLQLFQQPGEYRAKLVTVRGSARMISRFPAPRNQFGIDHYYRITLKPQGGPDNPILIYALGLPAQFPVPQEPEMHANVREEIECAGYFFKRLVFRSRDGLRTAPLVLAKLPRWYPAAVKRTTSRPNPIWVSVGVVACLVTAISLAWLAYQRTQRVAASHQRTTRQTLSLSIADDELVAAPLETLHQLAQSDSDTRAIENPTRH